MKMTRLGRLTAAAAMAAGLVVAQTGNTGAQPNTPHKQMRGMGEGRFFDRMAERLGLTEDQKAQAKAIFDKARTESEQYRPQLKTAREAFRNAVDSGASEAELQKAAENQAMVAAKLQVIRAQAMQEFRKLLTPDQLSKAEQMHGFMKNRAGRRR